MTETNQGSPPAPDPERLVRTVRHEVGDLLQSVYSTVAILQQRLPQEFALERQLVTDLKARAETTRLEIDAIVDLICPFRCSPETVNLSELNARLVATAIRRSPHLAVEVLPGEAVLVRADSGRLFQVCPLLVQAAVQYVEGTVQLWGVEHPAGGEGEWGLRWAGRPLEEEVLRWMEEPFVTTQRVLPGVGLALARRVQASQGGRLEVEPHPGGAAIRLFFPTANPPGS